MIRPQLEIGLKKLDIGCLYHASYWPNTLQESKARWQEHELSLLKWESYVHLDATCCFLIMNWHGIGANGVAKAGGKLI